MKFIHIADVHLGVCPNAGKAYTENRNKEIWHTFERVVQVCETEKADLLLIAGDLFHRQPLLRELRELDALFAELTHTKVVLIAGNHDYLKPDSYYRRYKWKSEVYGLMSGELDYIEFQELETCVYGLSYLEKEITEPLYDDAFPEHRQKNEILLAHGGDEKHIPIQKNRLIQLGYDYVAFGHIHRRTVLQEGKIEYAGSLEPTDKNDIGPHGYVKGEIINGNVKTEFVLFASREYIHTTVEMTAQMTQRELKKEIKNKIGQLGTENIYKITVTGFRAQDLELELEDMDVYGNVLEFVDDTQPYFDFEKLYRMNESNLLGKYIESLRDSEPGSVEYEALFEGVRALTGAKEG